MLPKEFWFCNLKTLEAERKKKTITRGNYRKFVSRDCR